MLRKFGVAGMIVIGFALSIGCQKQCPDGFLLDNNGNCVEIPPDDDDNDDAGDDDAAPHCSDTLVGTGWALGDTSEDFDRINQDGRTIHLWDYCDGAVLLFFSTPWEPGTEDRLDDLRGWFETWGPDRLMVIAVLSDPYAELDLADLAAYATLNSVDFEVVADEDFGLYSLYGGHTYIPWYVVLKPDAQISFSGSDGFNESILADAVLNL